MIRVELDIFSGEPNPTWTLSRKEENELLDQLEANPKLVQDMSTRPLKLGYRGYILHVEDDRGARRRGLRLPRRFRMGSLTQAERGSSLWLLGTADKPGVTRDPVREVAERGIINPPPPAIAPPTSFRRGQGGLPQPWPEPPARDGSLKPDPARKRALVGGPAGPSINGAEQYTLCDDLLQFVDSYDYYAWWNRSAVIEINNCYCFAANNKLDHFARPGRFGGVEITTDHSIGTVHGGMMADGRWNDVGCYVPEAGFATPVIAMVVWPGVDFHFYRLMAAWDNGRVWAHKLSTAPATNEDFHGVIISEPFNCEREPYTDFGGYYWGDAVFVDAPDFFDRTFRVPVW